MAFAPQPTLWATPPTRAAEPESLPAPGDRGPRVNVPSEGRVGEEVRYRWMPPDYEGDPDAHAHVLAASLEEHFRDEHLWKRLREQDDNAIDAAIMLAYTGGASVIGGDLPVTAVPPSATWPRAAPVPGPIRPGPPPACPPAMRSPRQLHRAALDGGQGSPPGLTPLDLEPLDLKLPDQKLPGRSARPNGR